MSLQIDGQKNLLDLPLTDFELLKNTREVCARQLRVNLTSIHLFVTLQISNPSTIK